MTGNQIAYYKARNERRNMRLERKEQKRHNLAGEAISGVQASAAMLGSKAAMLGSQAAAQQAQTRQKEYELQWENEYGLPYGSDPADMSNYRTVQYGEQYYLVPKAPGTQTYILKSAQQLEYDAKAGYERAAMDAKTAEARQRAVDTAQRLINFVGSTIDLGGSLFTPGNTPNNSRLDVTSSVPGTDLIIYGGQ